MNTQRIKAFVGKTDKYWYLIIALIIVLGVMNICLLPTYIPYLCVLAISTLLVFIAFIYLGIMLAIFDSKRKELFETRISETQQKISEISQQCRLLSDDINVLKQDIEIKHTALYNDIEKRFSLLSDDNAKRDIVLNEAVANCNTAISKAIDNSHSALNNDIAKCNNTLHDAIDNAQKGLTESTKILLDNVTSKITENHDLLTQTSSTLQQQADKINEKQHELLETKFSAVINSLDDMYGHVDVVQNKLTEEITSTINDVTEKSCQANGANFDKLDSRINELSGKLNSTEANLCERNDKVIGEIISQSHQLVNAIESTGIKTFEQIGNKVTLSGEQIVAQLKNAESVLAKKIDTTATDISKNMLDINSNINATISKAVDSVTLHINTLDKALVPNIDKLLLNDRHLSEQSKAENAKLIQEIRACISNSEQSLLNFSNSVKSALKEVGQENRVNLGANIDAKADRFEKLCVSQQFTVVQKLETLSDYLATIGSLTELLAKHNEGVLPDKSALTKPKPDRVEAIEDKNAGLTLRNTYKDGALKLGEMFRKTKKIFEIVYGDNKQVLMSRNYNERTGHLTNEVAFYPSGQVKERKEYSEGGKLLKTTKFNQDGSMQKH